MRHAELGVTESPGVSVTHHDGVALVTLDRPERRNVLDLGTVRQLVEVFDTLEADESIHAIVVTGRGTSFCAGADLETLAGGRTEDFLQIYDGFLRVRRSTMPTIAAINGVAVGAGLNLALCCDVRFVCDAARVVSRFPQLGLHPGGGHAWMVMQETRPELAAAMLLFGHELRGDEIVDAGLALGSSGSEDVVEAALSFAVGATTVPRPLLGRLKQTLRVHRAIGVHDEAVSVELEAQQWSKDQPFFGETIRSFRK
jgi:enoyl-CoA hydratase